MPQCFVCQREMGTEIRVQSDGRALCVYCDRMEAHYKGQQKYSPVALKDPAPPPQRPAAPADPSLARATGQVVGKTGTNGRIVGLALLFGFLAVAVKDSSGSAQSARFAEFLTGALAWFVVLWVVVLIWRGIRQKPGNPTR